MSKKQLEAQYTADGFVQAGSIRIPKELMTPTVTGILEVDRSFSMLEGIIPSQVVMVTGDPGSGKTTLCLAIGATLTKQGPVAFISLEMSKFQVAYQAKKIPGFERMWLTEEFSMNTIFEKLRRMKPRLVILDSIQKASAMMGHNHNGNQKEIVNAFTKFAKETWTPVFLVGHNNKGGGYQGPSTLLHEVDSHMTIEYEESMEVRNFGFGKNRFGGQQKRYDFGFTRDCVWIGSPMAIVVGNPENRELSGTNVDDLLNGITLTGNGVSTPDAPVGLPDLDPLMARCQWALRELRKQWDAGSIKTAVMCIHETLRLTDDQIPLRGYVKDPEKLKLSFRGNGVAHCHQPTGEIVFGKKSFRDNFQLGNIGYGREKKYISKHCKDKVDLLAWVVLHEWCHLYEGNDKHINAFYDQIETLAKKYSGLFNY